MENSMIDGKQKLTELIECDAVLTRLDSTPAFCYPKKGYIRIVKDTFKRSYMLELFAHTINIQSEKLNALTSVKLFKSCITPQFKKDKIVLNVRDDGLVSIEPKDKTKLEHLTTIIKNCLDDVNLVNGSLNGTKTQPTKSMFINQPRQTVEKANLSAKYATALDVLNEIVENEPATASSNVENPPNDETPKKQSVLAESSTSLTKNRFYVNQATSKVLNSIANKTAETNSTTGETNAKYVEFNLQSPVNNSLKRMRENVISTNEEEIKPVSANKNSNPSTRTILTPKRSNSITNNSYLLRLKAKQDSVQKQNKRKENQENINLVESSPVKTWNRTNSSNSCGKGFANLGNTCYMNAILQCLLNIDIFSDDLLNNYRLTNNHNNNIININKQKQLQQLTQLDENTQNTIDENILPDNLTNNDTKNAHECLYYCMCELIKANRTNDDRHKSESLLKIKNAISKEATRFSGYQQHDAHEFLCQVLDQLKDDVQNLNKLLSSNSHQHYLHSNTVVDYFQFEVTHAIECKRCNKITTKNEQYNNLCLELPNLKSFELVINTKTNNNNNNNNNNLNENRRDVKYGTKSNQSAFSLQEALDIFFKDESLNDFKCESCESIEEVIIRRSFHKLPKVLILYLKRYQFKEVVVAANQPEENKPTENAAANDSSDEQVAPSGGKTFKLVKNDANVRIPRYLTLRFLTEQEPILEQPLVEIKSPLKSSENVSVNSHKKQATDTAVENSAKSRKQLFSSTIDLTNNSPVKIHKNDSDDDDLVELDLKKAKYDSDKFMLNTNKFSEEDQLRLALELSMSENQKSTNLNSLLFLDGLFDDLTKCNNNNKVEDHKRLTRRGLKEISINSSNFDRSTADAKTETTQTAVVEELLDSTDDFEENTKKAIEESLLSYKSEMSKSYSYIPNDSILNDIKDPFQPDNTDQESTDQEENEKKISLHRNEHTQRIIEKNKQDGKEKNSFRIVGIVNHLGTTSNSGHYISDVYDFKTRTWSSYDDQLVEHLSEDEVLNKRSKTGYIFFYVHNSIESKMAFN